MQTNTNKINKSRVLLQTTMSKDEQNIVFMRTPQHGTRNAKTCFFHKNCRSRVTNILNTPDITHFPARETTELFVYKPPSMTFSLEEKFRFALCGVENMAKILDNKNYVIVLFLRIPFECTILFEKQKCRYLP